MKNMSIKRRCVTLIEMMIVMFLIALITGVVAYNYRGSLDEGKAFKTRTSIQKLETILNLEVAKHPEYRDRIATEWKQVIETSPMVHDANALTKDGWGSDYQVGVNPDNGAIVVSSQNLSEYEGKRVK